MKNISLEKALALKISPQISYQLATELCLALFCSVEWLPNVKVEEFTKENIANVFSRLVQDGFVDLGEEVVVSYDDCINISHWVDVIDSSLKENRCYDRTVVGNILGH